MQTLKLDFSVKSFENVNQVLPCKRTKTGAHGNSDGPVLLVIS